MIKTTLSAPWDEYYKKIEAMFAGDQDVRVVYDPEDYKVLLYVEDQAKAEALNYLLNPDVIFGNIALLIEVIPPNTIVGNTSKTPYDDALRNNEALWDIKRLDGVFKATYIIFKKKVVQYFNDDMSSFYGARSTLYEDIAKDIFIDLPGVYFCTCVIADEIER